MNIFKLFLAAFLVNGLAYITAGPTEAQNGSSENIVIEPGGKLWIEGRATITDYRCNAESLQGLGRLEDIDRPTRNVKGHGNVRVSVSIPVKALDCGKKAMNKDMYEALKADKHPDIRFRLLDATLSDSGETAYSDSTGWMQIKTKGILEVAGVADTTTISVSGMLLPNDRFRVKGEKKINMLHFDVEPPKALLGLIKADKHLTVHFDVTVRIKN